MKNQKNFKGIFKTLLVITFLSAALFIKPVSAATFPDVPPDHFAYDAVEALFNSKVIKGYDDGTFKPEKPVNRIEALKILLESAKLAVPEVSADETVGFPDIVGGQWYVRYVKKAKDSGIVKGNPDGTFAPERQVNKVELLKMLFLTNNIDLTSYVTSSSYPYADINATEWYYPYVNYAITFNIISPNELGNIEPGKMLSRADVAEIVYRFILVRDVGEQQVYLSQAESLLVQALANMEKQKYTEAKQNTADAVVLTQKAVAIDPEIAIGLAANKVAESMDQLTMSYLSLSEGNKDNASVQAQMAKNKAQEALDIDQSISPIIDKINTKADGIINHAKN